MRKVSYLMTMLAVAGTLFMSSCKKDPVDPVTASITFSPSSTVDYQTGDVVSVTVTITAGDAELSSLSVTDVSLGGDSTVTLSGTSDTYVYTTTIPSSFTDSVAVVTFDVTDIDGNVGTADLTINISAGYPATTVSTGNLMGAQSSAYGSYYSTSVDSVYKASDAAVAANAANIDLFFAQIGTPTTEPMLMSPDNKDEVGLSAGDLAGSQIMYIASTTLNIDNAADYQIDDIVQPSTRGTVVALGGTYAYVNASTGKKGLIYVSAFNAGTGVDGDITIKVRAQQ